MNEDPGLLEEMMEEDTTACVESGSTAVKDPVVEEWLMSGDRVIRRQPAAPSGV